ncbi:MAG: hypothetical protein P8X57_14045, partial [Cyclobacteriaceae bacterium]
YLAVGSPILAFGDTEGDAAEIIRACRAGSVFDWDEMESSRMKLLEWYNDYKKEALPKAKEVRTFSRKELTSKLDLLLRNYIS